MADYIFRYIFGIQCLMCKIELFASERYLAKIGVLCSFVDHSSNVFYMLIIIEYRLSLKTVITTWRITFFHYLLYIEAALLTVCHVTFNQKIIMYKRLDRQPSFQIPRELRMWSVSSRSSAKLSYCEVYWTQSFGRNLLTLCSWNCCRFI